MTRAAAKTKADEAQFHFSPLFAHNRPHVSPVEVSKALGIADQQVRDLIDAGIFLSVPINDQETPAGKQRREHVRILRFSVEAWWLERFLEKNGREYPLPNSAEIAWWRGELRAKKTGGTPVLR